MKNRINWKVVVKNSSSSLILIVIASFFQPFINVAFSRLEPSRVTGVLALLSVLILPLAFLSLLNIWLSKNKKSFIGSFVAIVFLVLIAFSYKYTPVTVLINNLIIFAFLAPVLVIAITRAANINGGYREIIIGSISGFIVGIISLLVASLLFFVIASMFVDVTARPSGGYLVGVLGVATVTMPFGFIFWFFIGLGEQVYLGKQKVLSGK